MPVDPIAEKFGPPIGGFGPGGGAPLHPTPDRPWQPVRTVFDPYPPTCWTYTLIIDSSVTFNEIGAFWPGREGLPLRIDWYLGQSDRGFNGDPVVPITAPGMYTGRIRPSGAVPRGTNNGPVLFQILTGPPQDDWTKQNPPLAIFEPQDGHTYSILTGRKASNGRLIALSVTFKQDPYTGCWTITVKQTYVSP